MKPFVLYVARSDIEKCRNNDTQQICGGCAIATAINRKHADALPVVKHEYVKYRENDGIFRVYECMPEVADFQRAVADIEAVVRPVILYFEPFNILEKQIMKGTVRGAMTGYVEILQSGDTFEFETPIHADISLYRVFAIDNETGAIQLKPENDALAHEGECDITLKQEKLNLLIQNGNVRRIYIE